jgi:hypothetical protein
MATHAAPDTMRAAATLTVALILLASPVPRAVAAPATHHAAGCELVIDAAREGRELARMPLDAQQPEVRIAFVHSVLGTTVIDRYRFLPQPVLVEEEFASHGYGLPDGPGPGERWEHLPGGRIRLHLHRPVDPLVVLTLPSQRMRILRPEGDLLLGSLGVSRVHLRAEGCPPGRRG